MSYYYNPKKISEKEFEYVSEEEFINTKEDDLFHIGQSYESKVASTVYCKHCGGKEFNVGIGSYFTAIRCIKCEWEVCIHDG